MSSLQSVKNIIDIIACCDEEEDECGYSRSPTKKRLVYRIQRELFVAQLEEREFSLRFRLSKSTFNGLLEKCSPLLSKNSHNYNIKPHIMLMSSLRWLAGGSYLDICDLFGISVGSFFQDNGVLWKTVEAINSYLSLSFPKSVEEFNEVSNCFNQSWNKSGIFKNIIGCIDGIVIKTRAPYKKEVDSIVSYRNRKGYFGIVALGVCNYDLTFSYFSCKYAGSTNDALAYNLSPLKLYIEENKPEGFYLIGDEGFPCSDNIIVPWSGTGLSSEKSAFNYYLSLNRQCIERSFGLLTRRWGILWRPLRVSFFRWSLVIMACIKLHNLCINYNDNNIPSFVPEDEKLMDKESIIQCNDKNEYEDRKHPQGMIRDNLTYQFFKYGIKRPKKSND